MAHGKVQKSQSCFGNFSTLDGVMVKIGDKFCPPKQVLLTPGLFCKKPTELLDFEYDFSLENQVIAAADEEKRLKSAQSIIKSDAPCDNEDQILAECSGENANVDSQITTVDQQGVVCSSSSLLASTEILIPISIPVSTTNADNKTTTKSYNDFNLSEFEDNNVTPFELVELQTLNDLDELKSVLQPENAAKFENAKPKANKTKMTCSTELEHTGVTTCRSTESDSSFQVDQGRITIASSRSSPSGQTITKAHHWYSNHNETNGPLGDSTYLFNNPYTNYVSTSIPSQHTDGQQATVYNAYTSTNLTSTNSKSLPSLTENVSGIGCEDKDISHDAVEYPSQNEGSMPPAYIQEDIVPTERISNIMRQYQFTRMSNTQNRPKSSESPYTMADMSTLTAMNTPSVTGRHNALPPLSHSPILPPVSGTPSVLYSSSDNGISFSIPAGLGQCPSRPEGPDIRKPSTPLIPPIQSPCTPDAISGRIVTSSSAPNVLTSGIRNGLPDPTAQLNDAEREFVYSLASMGFPMVRTARAVKRIGSDEKEVVEFLVHVQKVADMGYNADDVELALANNKDIDNTLKYLKVLGTLKEFGFPEPSIHDALKQASGDRDAALEILMG